VPQKLEKIGWTENVKNEEVLHSVKEERNILQSLKRRIINWICYILCGNCFVKHDIEGKIEGRMEVIGRLGRSKQLQDDLKETGG
jgi:hypothetical protein